MKQILIVLVLLFVFTVQTNLQLPDILPAINRKCVKGYTLDCKVIGMTMGGHKAPEKCFCYKNKSKTTSTTTKKSDNKNKTKSSQCPEGFTYYCLPVKGIYLRGYKPEKKCYCIPKF